MKMTEAASINIVGLFNKHNGSISINISHQVKRKKADQRNVNSFALNELQKRELHI